jgi:hypothetical protein
MRDPFKNRTNDDLAIQYLLLSGEDAPTKMYSPLDVHLELVRRIGGGPEYEQLMENARNILKMVALYQ